VTATDKQTPMSIPSPVANIIWDSHYDNPKAEIILISDDMIGFRVKAWQLKKQR
jgi:hypothetical protein